MDNSFIFHEAWTEAISQLDKDDELAIFRAVVDYGLTGQEPANLNGALYGLFCLIKKQIDFDKNLRQSKSNAGKKGMESRYKNQQNVNTSNTSQQNLTNDNTSQQEITNDNLYVYDNVYVNDNVYVDKKNKQKKVFRKPTVEEVEAYCKERGNGINAEQFVNHYEAKGWMIGKQPMKDWQAAVRTWERTNKRAPQQEASQQQEERDPNLPDPKEWEAFLHFVEARGGLDITGYQYMKIKSMCGNDSRMIAVIIEACKKGPKYLSNNLEWKVEELLRNIIDQSTETK